MNLPPVDKSDSFTFRARIQAKTPGGAYLVEDVAARHKTFVPVRQCIVAPKAFALGQEVEVTLSRSLARQKGFLRDAPPSQEKLL